MCYFVYFLFLPFCTNAYLLDVHKNCLSHCLELLGSRAVSVYRDSTLRLYFPFIFPASRATKRSETYVFVTVWDFSEQSVCVCMCVCVRAPVGIRGKSRSVTSLGSYFTVSRLMLVRSLPWNVPRPFLFIILIPSDSARLTYNNCSWKSTVRSSFRRWTAS